MQTNQSFTLLGFFSVLLLCVPSTSFAQDTREPPRFSIGVHGNTGSPPMLGLSYFFNDRVALRGSAGFYPEDGSYSITTTQPSGPINVNNVEYNTQWYGGALAGLYYLPALWRLQFYSGLKTQYVWASSKAGARRNQTSDRIDVGALAGTELRVFSWLRFSGEVGIGYKSGLNANTGIVDSDSLIGMREESEFGLMHAGLGIQIRID